MQNLIDKIKKIHVGVIGLGYVFHCQFCLQKNLKFLDLMLINLKLKIKKNQSYLNRIDSSVIKKSKKFYFTSNFSNIKNCIIIICVPTPLNNKLKPNLKYLKTLSKLKF